MVTRQAPSAWRAISPVSSVTWYWPNGNVFLIDFTVSSCVCGRVRARAPAAGWSAKRKNPAGSPGEAARGFVPGGGSLLAQAEPVDHRTVGLDVRALQVVEQAAA